MNSSKILVAGAAALLSLASAHADVSIHITGSTAFRKGTINAIIGVMGGNGAVKSAYKTGTGITGPNDAGQTVIQGTVALHPEFGTVTVKAVWSGSSGGVKTIVQNLDIATAPGWPSITNLGTVGTPNGLAALDYTLDFGGETLKTDVCMSDAKQVTTGFTSAGLTETKVGVIPFEWVVGNQSPAVASAITNITPLQAQAVISGGAPLSTFTSNSAHASIPVYAVGRDADSGTRISALAETGVGVFGSVQHIQVVTTGGTGDGTAGATISKLYLWPASTLLGVAYPIGNGGYSGGGGVANVLATPGSTSATTSDGGATIPSAQEVLFGAGQLVGYLGRSDARTAVKTGTIATNNAHRLAFNGVTCWSGNDNTSDGTPSGGYDDSKMQEGVYQCWEFEWLSYRTTYGTTSPNGKSFTDLVAARIASTDGTASGILLSTMHVTRAVEGGVITEL